MLTHRRTRARRPRRGLAATETLLVLPIFVLVVVAMVGFTDLIIAEQKMDEASARAARIVAAGGSQKQAEAAVLAVLGPDRARYAKIHVTPVSKANDKGDQCEDGEGDEDDEHKKAAHHLELIEVRVELEVRHAAATKFVPLKGTELLIGRTVVHRQ